MTATAAPLYTDIGAGPVEGAAYWLNTVDDVRIRIGIWAADAPKGTVLLFCGRTEYIEKYGLPAGDLAARGYATVAIDWRGQGLADRLLEDTRIGHVGKFSDYQHDVKAVVDAARVMGLPEPYYMIGHSMGGCIGLRSLYEGLPVAAAAFTGPMWGIGMAAYLRPVAWALGRLVPAIGFGNRLAPGTIKEPYVLSAPFEDNTLTRTREMWDMMQAQLKAHPEFSLGGPSFVWLRSALDETLDLAQMPAPDVPCLTFLGDNERIVDPTRVYSRMKGWKNGTLQVIEGGEHEVLMEDLAKRSAVFDTMTAFFAKAG